MSDKEAALRIARRERELAKANPDYDRLLAVHEVEGRKAWKGIPA